MRNLTRRNFLSASGAGLVGAAASLRVAEALGQISGDRPSQDERVQVLNPQARVPISFVIDDSTCLVNLNKFAIPQFASAWGKRGKFTQAWRKMPDEIPDDFVRKFGEWCGERGVKGKYSIVPFPACVGRIDRVLPGWTDRALKDSLDLVRTLMLPNWDIHPEMVTHTWVIDTKTGHPLPEKTIRQMENWEWTKGRSVDEMADYMSYALKILKNVGLPCEGVTTPGGFGIQVLPELAQATLEACKDVGRTEIPHYFRHIYGSGNKDVTPRVEYVSGLDSSDPKCVVSIIGCTGDWTGGWDCSRRGEPDRFITADLKQGRMVDIIERQQPAVMVCHWTGMYFNGDEEGFNVFREVVRRIHTRFDNLLWMKLSEISRYWAARELTSIAFDGGRVTLTAPFATTRFTLYIKTTKPGVPKIASSGTAVKLKELERKLDLRPGTWLKAANGIVACFNLEKGKSIITV